MHSVLSQVKMVVIVACENKCNTQQLTTVINMSFCRINRDNDRQPRIIVQELCESRGGRPELSVLTSLLVSVDVQIY